MRAQSVWRIPLVLVLLALLAPAMAQAMPFNVKAVEGGGEQVVKPLSWIEVLWQELVRIWTGNTASGAGPGLDPNGDPTTPSSGSTPPGTGADPYIDPHGGTGPA